MTEIKGSLDKSKLLLIAIQAVDKSYKEIKKYIADNKITVDSQDGKDVKLEIDKKSELIICDYLKSKSEFSILGEEFGFHENKNIEYRWIVDPLDGSYNLLRNFPFCCISIALWNKDTPVIAVIKNVNNGDLYTAISGEGAFLNNNKITVSNISSIEQSVLSTGFPLLYDHKNSRYLIYMQKFKKVRMIGSAAMSLAHVAAGIFDYYYEENIRIWDVAAGLLLVREAGGEIDFWETKDNTTLVVKASNPSLINTVWPKEKVVIK